MGGGSQDGLHLVHREGGVGLEHEGHHAAYVGSGHGSPVFQAIGSARQAGADLYAGGDDLRFELTPGRWASAAEGRHHVHVVGRAHGNGFWQAGGAAKRGGGRPFVSDGKDRYDACGPQGLKIGTEGLVLGGGIAPGTVDYVRGQPRIARRGQDPLEGGMHPAIIGIALAVESPDGDPLGSGCDADCLTVCILTTHSSASDMGAMAGTIHRVLEGTFIGGADPVPLVDSQASRFVAAVLSLQGGVLPVHPRVDDGDGHTLTVQSEGTPGQVGTDYAHIPLHVAFSQVGLAFHLLKRINPTTPAILADEGDIRPGGYGQQGLGVSGHGDGVDYPKGTDGLYATGSLFCLQERQESGLCVCGRSLQVFH